MYYIYSFGPWGWVNGGNIFGWVNYNLIILLLLLLWKYEIIYLIKLYSSLNKTVHFSIHCSNSLIWLVQMANSFRSEVNGSLYALCIESLGLRWSGSSPSDRSVCDWHQNTTRAACYFFTFNFSKNSEKCITVSTKILSSTTVFNINYKKKCETLTNLFGRISERSCCIKTGAVAAENTALPSQEYNTFKII